MSAWNHAICDECWEKREPGRVPCRVNPQYAEAELCCFCGKLTQSGIYVRQRPGQVPCGGKHAGPDESSALERS